MKHQYYIVSEIVSLGDDINKKGKAVNKCLKEISKLTVCSYWNTQMQFLVHTLIEVKLYIHQNGTTLFASNFLNVFKRV